jgi:NitT/TauT family transport system substrate-binding protein
MPIRIYESFRAVFYTPFYLPHALGAYEAEGLDVTLGTSPSLDFVASHLTDGEADVYWGGPMRIMVNRDRDPDCAIVGFCEVVTRDPFFLVGAEPRPDFAFADLERLTLGSVSEVPTPWMCLQDDLRRAGIDPDGVRRVTDASMADNAAALREGAIDVAQLFQPFVEQLLADGAGHIWRAAADRGPCSYTTLYCLRSTIERDPDTLLRMTRAMYRSQKWLHTRSSVEVAAAVGSFFPQLPADLLAGAIDRYRSLGVWGRNPRLPEQGFERLRTALLSGGLIKTSIPYEDCVDMRFADAVIAEDPPSM